MVTVGVEVGDAEVNAAFVLRVLPTDILADGKARFVRIGTKRDKRSREGSPKRDKR